MVEHLISIGADCGKTVMGWTPTEHAAQCGNAAILAMLLRATPLLNLQLIDGDTLCHYAARNPDSGAMALILPIDSASCMDPNEQGYLPLDLAALNENEQVMAQLLAQKDHSHHLSELIELEDDFFGDGESLVHIAAANKNEKVLALLIAAGADLTLRNARGDCPIHIAAANPNAAVVRLLIGASVDVHVVNSQGKNALFIACSNPNEEVFNALCAAGARWRDTPHVKVCDVIAQNTNEAILRGLIERGVDVNSRSVGGLTMLMHAAGSATVRSVSLLLDAGADVRATDNQGHTVMHHACMNAKHCGIVRVLLAAGVPADDGLGQALYRNNLDAVKAFVDGGAVVWPLDVGTMRTAAIQHESDFLSFLLRQGSYNVSEFVDYASDACLQVLFAHGADLNVTNHSGYTKMRTADGIVLALLIAAGVDTLQRDFSRLGDDDETAALLAAVGHPEFDGRVPRRLLAWATSYIAQRQLELLRLRAFQVCVGLQSLRLPALQQCEILAHAFAPLESFVAFHRVWAIVTTIKHFRPN